VDEKLVVEPRDLTAHAAQLGGLARLADAHAGELRRALGYLVNHPEIPNGGAVAYAYGNSLRTLEETSLMAADLGRRVVSYADDIVRRDSSMILGTGPTVRGLPGRAGGSRSGHGGGLFSAILNVVRAAAKVVKLVEDLTTIRTAVRDARGTSRTTKPTLSPAEIDRRSTLRLLNEGSVDDLKKIKGIKEDTANRIVLGREKGPYTSVADLERAGVSRDKIRSADEGLSTWARKERIRSAERLGKPAGEVGKVEKAGKFTKLGKKLKPFIKPLGPAGDFFAITDDAKELTDDGYDNPEKLGGDNWENAVALVDTGTVVLTVAVPVAVAAGLITIGAGGVILVVGAVVGVGVAVYEAGPIVWKYGKKGVHYVGDKARDLGNAATSAARETAEDAGRAAVAVKDRLEDTGDKVRDTASDAKDAVGDTVGDVTDGISSKAQKAKEKVTGWIPKPKVPW